MTDATRALDLLLGTAWAIDPEAMQTIIGIAQRVNDSPEAVSAKLGRPLDNARRVTERDGTAIIPVTGPIFRRANLFTEISGATSVEVLAQDLATAAADPSIERIVLDIDSPGGQASGIAEMAAQIRASTKPVTAYVDGAAASAAYWLAAAADQVVASPTALLGSIGVVASYQPEKDGPVAPKRSALWMNWQPYFFRTWPHIAAPTWRLSPQSLAADQCALRLMPCVLAWPMLWAASSNFFPPPAPPANCNREVPL